MSTSSRQRQTPDSSFDETIEGIGTWTGVVARSADLRRRLADRRHGFFDLLERQIRRYRWFSRRIEEPRAPDACARELRRRRRGPGAWVRAMVELTLADEVRAKMVLDQWDPPTDEPALELFRRVCLVEAESRSTD